MIASRIQDHIAILTIDMPGRTMNVLTPDFVHAFRTAFDAVAMDADVVGIIITSGKASFIAGADLSQMQGMAACAVTAATAAQMSAIYGDLFRHIETGGKPVVAAAPGTALGGGLELMLACHYRVAADNPGARFGLPEVKLGLLPVAGGTQRLPRLVGIAAAIPFLTEGYELTAAAARSAGLIHEVVPADRLLEAAQRALKEGRVKAMAPWDEKGFRLPGGDAYAAANQNALSFANASLHAATHGNYPAPVAILRCLYEGTKLPIDKALKLEQQLFATLVQGRVAQSMVRTLFCARQSADEPPAMLARSLDYVRQIGKTPIVVKDDYGSYTTRCVVAYMREGMRLLVDGVTPPLIENAGTALGLPVGPLALADDFGLDVMHHIAHFFREKERGAWADDRHERVNALLDQLVLERRFGRKTGAGFYAYPAGAAKHLDRAYIAACVPAAKMQPTVAQVKERLLYAQLVEAARCWADGVIGVAREADLGAVLGWAFPSWLGGPMAAIDGIGVPAFVARCAALADELGQRFAVPQSLRDAAGSGFCFHIECNRRHS